MNPAQHDFYHKFNSRSGVPSECHFRILSTPNRPVVVICSQVFRNDGHPSGWSICNAFEQLLDDIQVILRKQAVAGELNEIRDYFLKAPNFICATMAMGCHLILQGGDLLRTFQMKSENTRQFIWIEHWPRYYDCGNGTGYWRVNFDKQSRPKWQPVENLQELAGDLGYSLSEIKKPAWVFKGARYAEV